MCILEFSLKFQTKWVVALGRQLSGPCAFHSWPPRLTLLGSSSSSFASKMTDEAPSGHRPGSKAFRIVTLGFVVAVSSANVVRMSVGTPPALLDSFGVANNYVMRREQRFSAIRAGIAARGLSGTLGYLGEQPKGQWQVGSNSVENYYLAQFVLAPLILDADAVRREWIVADLPKGKLAARTPSGWSVAEDFGDGTFLLRREPP